MKGRKIDFGKEWRRLKESLGYLRAAFPYALSHHPHCRAYDRDVFHIGRYRLCTGCFVAYPTAIALIIVLLITGYSNRFPWYYYLIVGVVFGSFEFISLWRKGSGFRHHIIKFFLGIGLALFTIGVFRIPLHFCFQAYIFYALFLLAGLFAGMRMKYFDRRCRRCVWGKRWNECPGFEELRTNLEKEGFDAKGRRLKD